MIRAEHLTMRYGSTQALRDATFEVRPQEVLGLLGPNGAGKTTAIRILTTFLRPTSGRVVIDGIDAFEDPIAVRRMIGYLPETTPVYVEMLVSDYLDFVGAARGLSGAALASRKDAVVAATSLESVYNWPISHLSKGFRQRVGLAQALIHDPQILILDEPTSGLDPLQIIGIRELIRELSATKTILFSTHILQEIEAVSDRVMIINEGRIIAEGAPAELQRRVMGSDRLAVEVEGPADAVSRALSALPGALSVQQLEGKGNGTASFFVRHEFDDGEACRGVERAVREGGWSLRRLTPDRYSLEQVFIDLTSAAGNEDGAEASVGARDGGQDVGDTA